MTSHPVRTEDGILSFRTAGQWEVADVVGFLDVIESIYSVFLLLYQAKHLLHADSPPSRLDSEEDAHRMALGILAFLGVGVPPEVIPSEDTFWVFGEVLNQRGASIFDEVRSRARRGYFGLPGHNLRVHAIQIRSPGEISLAGLGEPIHQIRELIKDLWYRNRQERRRGEIDLEMIQMHLNEYKRRSGLPESSIVDRASLLLAEGLGDVRDLEANGKLHDVPGSLDEAT